MCDTEENRIIATRSVILNHRAPDSHRTVGYVKITTDKYWRVIMTLMIACRSQTARSPKGPQPSGTEATDVDETHAHDHVSSQDADVDIDMKGTDAGINFC